MAENKNAQQVREITDKLEQGIKELFESERFKEYLRTMSKFYNYSFNNTLLIAMQNPVWDLLSKRAFTSDGVSLCVIRRWNMLSSFSHSISRSNISG